MPCGRPSTVGTGHSVNFSVCGSNRPSLLAPISANQIRPSGAATRQWGALFGVGMSYSTMGAAGTIPTPRSASNAFTCLTFPLSRFPFYNPVILMPSTMNCTAIAHSTSPISRGRMRTPVWPSRRSTRAAAARGRYDSDAVSVIAHVHAPRRAIARRTSGVSRAVIARKLGTAVRGSTMNNTEVKIRNSSCRVFTMGRRSDRHLHDPVLARPFGLVHRRVGLAEHVVGVRVATGPGHDPDARGHGRGAAEHGSDAARQSGGRGVGDGAVGLGHQDRELVAPEPADDVRLAHGGAHRVRDEAQHRVARRVTVRVVHPLEVVQVEVDQRQRPAVPAGWGPPPAPPPGGGGRGGGGGGGGLGWGPVRGPPPAPARGPARGGAPPHPAPPPPPPRAAPRGPARGRPS